MKLAASSIGSAVLELTTVSIYLEAHELRPTDLFQAAIREG
jgi:hypothetical protein